MRLRRQGDNERAGAPLLRRRIRETRVQMLTVRKMKTGLLIPSPYRDPPEVERALKLGYYVVQHSEYHFRFNDRFDLYAPKWKWADQRTSTYGQGVKSLIAHMIAVSPVAES